MLRIFRSLLFILIRLINDFSGQLLLWSVMLLVLIMVGQKVVEEEVEVVGMERT
jgi:hypothetical protein